MFIFTHYVTLVFDDDMLWLVATGVFLSIYSLPVLLTCMCTAINRMCKTFLYCLRATANSCHMDLESKIRETNILSKK